jgi:uncharacterized protein YcfJ
MMKSWFAVCAVAGMLALSACSGMGRGETVGTVGGAAAGGYAGHEAGVNQDKKHQ